MKGEKMIDTCECARCRSVRVKLASAEMRRTRTALIAAEMRHDRLATQEDDEMLATRLKHDIGIAAHEYGAAVHGFVAAMEADGGYTDKAKHATEKRYEMLFQ